MPARTCAPRTIGSRAVVAQRDDVGVRERVLESRDRRRRQALRRERRRRALGAVGDAGPTRSTRAMSRTAQCASAMYGASAPVPTTTQRARVRARQVGRRERGRRRRATQRHRLAVDQRDRVAGRAVHQHVERADARDPALVVAREHRDDLDAEPGPVPRRHQQQAIALGRHRVARAHGRRRARDERGAQRVDERAARRAPRGRRRPGSSGSACAQRGLAYDRGRHASDPWNRTSSSSAAA